MDGLTAGQHMVIWSNNIGIDNAILEAFQLVKWYGQEHVVLCLDPAFFTAGAIGVLISQASVMKYPGPKANKALAYGVVSVSGAILTAQILGPEIGLAEVKKVE